jgi:hypothetical protein
MGRNADDTSITAFMINRKRPCGAINAAQGPYRISLLLAVFFTRMLIPKTIHKFAYM